jgi:hypothetical protein
MKFGVLNSSHATNPGIAFVWQWTPVDSHFIGQIAQLT